MEVSTSQIKRTDAPPQLIILFWHHCQYYRRNISSLLLALLPLPVMIIVYLLVWNSQRNTVLHRQCIHDARPSVAAGLFQTVHYESCHGQFEPIIDTAGMNKADKSNYLNQCLNSKHYAQGLTIEQAMKQQNLSGCSSFDDTVDKYEKVRQGKLDECSVSKSILGSPYSATSTSREDLSLQWIDDVDQLIGIYDRTVMKGYILYYPNNDATKLIIDRLQDKLRDVNKLLKAVDSIIETDKMVDALTISNMLSHIRSLSGCFLPIDNRVLAFPSFDKAQQFATELAENNTKVLAWEYSGIDNNNTENMLRNLWGIVGFNIPPDATELPNIVSYELIQDTSLHDLDVRNQFLQDLIESSIVQVIANISTDISFATRQLPTKCSKPNNMKQLLSWLIPYLMCCLFFVYIPSHLLKQIVEEKNLKLHDYMQIMGVNALKLKISWILFFMMLLLPFIVILVIWLWILPNTFMSTDFSIAFILTVQFCVAQLALCFLLRFFINLPEQSDELMQLLIFVFILPTLVLVALFHVPLKGTSTLFVRFSCLHCVTPVFIGFFFICQWQFVDNYGSQWSTLMISPDSESNFGGIGECMIWLLVDTVLYILISWYIENVFPGQYGIKRKPWFFFLPSYWRQSVKKPNTAKSNYEAVETVEETSFGNVNTETVPEMLLEGVKIKNLSKSYTNVVALNKLNINFYEDEVSILLGQNGAGKSTTMNILVGLISPSDGSAEVAGFDLESEIGSIRKIVGFVPQNDILYPSLTVYQHVLFYGWLKGLNKDFIFQFTKPMLIKLDLDDHLQTLCSNLSGGQKRKLSVVTAFLGVPDVIILDEPTSGIDPFSRQAIWQMITTRRKHMTTIISTHHMDEVDVLADRVAVIAEGTLRAYGSPLFLKNRYGSGFCLTVVMRDDASPEKAINFLTHAIPKCTFNEQSGSDVSFTIPIEVAHSDEMSTVLEELETQMESLQVVSYGVVEPTMEQVFFSATKSEKTTPTRVTASPETTTVISSTKIEYEPVVGAALKLQQCLALFRKRVKYSIRTRSTIVFQLIIPIFWILLMLLVSRSGSLVNLDDRKEISLHSKWREESYFYQDVTTQQNEKIGEKIIRNTLVKSYGVGGRRGGSSGGGGDFLIPRGIVEQFFASPTSVKTNSSVTVNIQNVASCECTEDRCVAPSKFGDFNWVTQPDGSQWVNLQDVDDRNVVDWLPLFNQPPEVLIGGWQFRDLGQFPTSPAPYDTNGTILELLQSGNNENYVLLWHKHDMRAEMVNVWHNEYLRYLTQSNKYSIKLSKSSRSILSDQVKPPSRTDIMVILIVCLFAFLAFVSSAVMTVTVVQNENNSRMKWLQFVTGVHPVLYVIINFVYDYLLYLISSIIVIIMIAVFDNVFQPVTYLIVMVVIPFGLAVIALGYVLCHFFNTAATVIKCQMYIMILSQLTGPALCFFVWRNEMCSTFKHDQCQFQWAFYLDVIIGLVFPQHLLIGSLYTIGMGKVFDAKQELSIKYSIDRMVLMTTVRRMFIAILSFLIYFGTSLLLQLYQVQFELTWNKVAKVLSGNKQPDPPVQKDIFSDRDVRHEAKRIAKIKTEELTPESDDAIVVKSLSKVYSGSAVPAVDRISFGVKRKECFGLLGLNGAGKTTTFDMLTGVTEPTMGSMTLNGHDVVANNAECRKVMSYCLQTDILFELLTVSENIELFSALHGYPKHEATLLTEALIIEIDLTEFKNRKVCQLSGGNKRKVSLVVSMIGYRPILFLDEPTTGMDPGSRRLAWNLIQNAISNKNCSVVLTSHSMEECEKLCNRLVIMIAGQLRCIGSVQYLKNKFGNQYMFKLKLDSQAAKFSDEIKRLLNENIKNAKLLEEHSNLLEYKVDAKDNKLSHIFATISKIRQEFGLLHFSISQMTLEHTFIEIGRIHELLKSGHSVTVDLEPDENDDDETVGLIGG